MSNWVGALSLTTGNISNKSHPNTIKYNTENINDGKKIHLSPMIARPATIKLNKDRLIKMIYLIFITPL